jgi:hypothetical protein
MYDRPFFYIFLWMDEANLANKKIVKRNLVGRELRDFLLAKCLEKAKLKIESFKKREAILEVFSIQK